MDVEKKAEGVDGISLNLPRVERDPSKPLCISAGCDNLLKIGEPQGAGQINKPLEELWRMEVEKNF